MYPQNTLKNLCLWDRYNELKFDRDKIVFGDYLCNRYLNGVSRPEEKLLYATENGTKLEESLHW